MLKSSDYAKGIPVFVSPEISRSEGRIKKIAEDEKELYSTSYDVLHNTPLPTFENLHVKAEVQPNVPNESCVLSIEPPLVMEEQKVRPKIPVEEENAT